ncbi:MAG: hypothetical protein C4296_13665 [Gemmataceae bacterium]
MSGKIYELIYTSAERGLALGSQGFCTVQRTQGLPSSTQQLLERLSSYPYLYPPDDPRNAPLYLHIRLTGMDGRVLSCIRPAPPDYSGRNNFLAHHIVLRELPQQIGPVGLIKRLDNAGYFLHQWDGGAVELTPRDLPTVPGNARLRVCESWQRFTGDAGWAGVIAEHVHSSAGSPLYLIVPDSDPRLVLDLLEEVELLLQTRNLAWSLTFATLYFPELSNVGCVCRALTKRQGQQIRRTGQRYYDIEELRGKRAPDTLWAEMARTGQPASIEQPSRGPLVPATGAAFELDISDTYRIAEDIGHKRPSKGTVRPRAYGGATMHPDEYILESAPTQRTGGSLIWNIVQTILLLAVLCSILLLAVLVSILRPKYDELVKPVQNSLVKAVQKSVEGVQSEIRLLDGSINNLRNQLADVKESQDQVTKALQEQLTERVEELGKLCRRLVSNLETLKNKKPKDNQELEKLIGQLQSDVNNLSNELERLKKSIEAMTGQPEKQQEKQQGDKSNPGPQPPKHSGQKPPDHHPKTDAQKVPGANEALKGQQEKQHDKAKEEQKGQGQQRSQNRGRDDPPRAKE